MLENAIPLFKDNVTIVEFASGMSSSIKRNQKVIPINEFIKTIDENFLDLQYSVRKDPELGRYLRYPYGTSSLLLVNPTKAMWLDKTANIDDMEEFMNVNSIYFKELLSYADNTKATFLWFKKDIHKKYGIMLETSDD